MVQSTIELRGIRQLFQCLRGRSPFEHGIMVDGSQNRLDDMLCFFDESLGNRLNCLPFCDTVEHCIPGCALLKRNSLNDTDGNPAYLVCSEPGHPFWYIQLICIAEPECFSQEVWDNYIDEILKLLWKDDNDKQL